MSFIELADRMKKVPPYLFARIDAIKQEELDKGRELISLSIGDPDLPTPDFIIEKLYESAKNPANHQYPSYVGMIEFREAVSRWYENRFGVSIDPKKEALTLIGSKEGVAHLPLAFVNPGEGVLLPNPGYPVYEASTHLAGGVPIQYEMHEKDGFLPTTAELEAKITNFPGRVRMIWLNYPSNPTSAPATVEFFEEMVLFAKKHDLIIAHDAAYTEIYFDGKKQPSFMQARGAKDVGIELHSVSKSFNMTGWRVGMAVGNPELISGLGQVKTNVDSGAFNACQEAAIAALDNFEPFCSDLRAIYQERRDILVPALDKIGLPCPNTEASFFCWAKLPEGVASEDYVLKLIREQGIIATPGNGFGTAGEGYVRFTLCADKSVLKRVAEMLQASV